MRIQKQRFSTDYSIVLCVFSEFVIQGTPSAQIVPIESCGKDSHVFSLFHDAVIDGNIFGKSIIFKNKIFLLGSIIKLFSLYKQAVHFREIILECGQNTLYTPNKNPRIPQIIALL